MHTSCTYHQLSLWTWKNGTCKTLCVNLLTFGIIYGTLAGDGTCGFLYATGAATTPSFHLLKGLPTPRYGCTKFKCALAKGFQLKADSVHANPSFALLIKLVFLRWMQVLQSPTGYFTSARSNRSFILRPRASQVSPIRLTHPIMRRSITRCVTSSRFFKVSVSGHVSRE